MSFGSGPNLCTKILILKKPDERKNLVFLNVLLNLTNMGVWKGFVTIYLIMCCRHFLKMTKTQYGVNVNKNQFTPA